MTFYRMLIDLLQQLFGVNRRIKEAVITDKHGKDELILWVIEKRSKGHINGKLREIRSYKFSSLEWRTLYEGEWRQKLKIGKRSFKSDRNRDRCVVGVRNFKASTGNALLVLCERRPRNNKGSFYAVYSLNLWNLTKNQNLRKIKELDLNDYSA